MNHLLAADKVFGIAKIADFYDKGGIIMYALTACSLVTLTVIVFKALDLAKPRVIPQMLRSKIEQYSTVTDENSASDLSQQVTSSDSVLSRLAQVVIKRKDSSGENIRNAVQAKAHEEIVKLQGGIQILDAVIVIAPLLGLLGTASGITTVFGGLSSIGDVKMNIMAQGVAEALSTTIAGLAVAVPAVIGNSIFNRKIETYASQLEVVMEELVNTVSDQSDESPTA